jgi:hypothetical protein
MGDGHFPKDEGVKNGQDVLAVSEHVFQHAVIHGIVLRQALPAFQHVGRDIDILAQFLQRVPPQEEAVEKCRFVLRLSEIEIRSSHTLSDPIRNSKQKQLPYASKILSAGPYTEAQS